MNSLHLLFYFLHSAVDDATVVVRGSRRDAAVDLERVAPALRERLGTEASAGLISLLDDVRAEWSEDVMEVSAYRYERRLAEETSKLRVEMAEGFAALRGELASGLAGIRQELSLGLAQVRQEMAKGDAELRVAIADQKFEILKWTFVFWTGQFFVTASFLVMLVRALRPG
jgi:hypothetical protein